MASSANEKMVPKISHEKALGRIQKYIFVTLAIVGPALYWAWTNLHHYILLPDMPHANDRVIFTLQCHALTIMVLFNMFLLVGNMRAAVAWNPLNPDTEQKMKTPVQILTNTVEQSLIFVPSTLILSTYLDGENQMVAIPVLVVLFAIARTVFAIGYLAAPIYRSPGFFMTLMTNVVALTLVSYHTWMRGSIVAYPMAVAVMAVFAQQIFLKSFYKK